MTDSDYTKLVEETIGEVLPIVDEAVEEIVKKLTDFGNPEKLLKMPYEAWKNDPNILQRLAQIYGAGNDSALARFIFKKEWIDYERLKQQNQATGGTQ